MVTVFTVIALPVVVWTAVFSEDTYEASSTLFLLPEKSDPAFLREFMSPEVNALYHVILKSRSLAQAIIEQGTTRIDGKRAEKPSDGVKVGSVIALPLGGRVRVIRVLTLPERRGPASEARSVYAEIDENSAAT